MSLYHIIVISLFNFLIITNQALAQSSDPIENIIFISGDGDFTYFDYFSKEIKEYRANKVILKKIINNSIACNNCITHIFYGRHKKRVRRSGIRKIRHYMKRNINLSYMRFEFGKKVRNIDKLDKASFFELSLKVLREEIDNKQRILNIAYFGHTIKEGKSQSDFLYILKEVTLTKNKNIDLLVLSSCQEVRSKAFSNFSDTANYVLASEHDIPLTFFELEELFSSEYLNAREKQYKKILESSFIHMSKNYFPKLQIGLYKNTEVIFEKKKLSKFERHLDNDFKVSSPSGTKSKMNISL